MLCFRCGSHVKEGSDECWNCGFDLSQRKNAPTSDLRARQRTGLFGVVYKLGDMIADRYRVKDIVGSGGAGVVYRAQDREVDVDVAVKVINGKLVQTEEERRLLARHITLAKKLAHQNCVRIYDDGMDDERPYFTMQFLEGLSLRRIIDLRREKGHVFTAAEVEPIFNQLCQALDFAHQTTFHGNLKPDNVLVLPDLLKVTDFGLLRGLPRKPFLALQKTRGHNLRYLAPEVRFEVAELDRSVDVYSLGVVLAEMMTGHVFSDEDPSGLDAALLGIDDELASVVRRSTARTPTERFESASEFYRALRSALQAGEVVTVSDPVPVSAAASSAVPVEAAPVSVPVEAAPVSAPVSAAPVASTDVPATVAVSSNPLGGEETTHTGAEPEQPAPVIRAHQDAPTERLDIARHGPRPDSIPAMPNEALLQGSSIVEPIEDHMIEFEALTASQLARTEAAGPRTEDEGLIDNPAGATLDLGEEDDETQAIEEPDPGVQALRARVEARMQSQSGAAIRAIAADPAETGPAPRSASLVEISNSAIELIADPRATNIGSTPTRETPNADPLALRSGAIDVAHETTSHGELAPPESPAPRVRRPSTRPPRPSAKIRPRPNAPAPMSSPWSEAVRAPTADAVQSSTPTSSPAPGSSSARSLALQSSQTPSESGASLALAPSAAPASPQLAPFVARPSVVPVVTGSPTAEPPEDNRAAPVARGAATPANGHASGPQPTGAPARRPMKRPMTRPRVPLIRPVSVPRSPTQSLALPVPPPVAPAPPAPLPVVEPPNRLVYLMVAASFMLILIAFVAVVVITTDQQRQNQAEIALLREQIQRETQAATQARAAEKAARLEAEARGEAERQADQVVRSADRQLARSSAAKRRAESAAEAKRASAQALRAKAASVIDLGERRRAEARAAAAAKAARKKEAEVAAAAERARVSREKKAAAEARRAREAEARRAAEQRAEAEAEAARQAEAKAARLSADSVGTPEDDDVLAASPRRPIVPEASPRPRRVPIRPGSAGPRGPVSTADRVIAAAATAARVESMDGGTPTCPRGMQLVSGGTFMMGSRPNDPERNFDDLRLRAVEVSAVCIDYYEYPNGRGRAPSAKVSWKTAKARCQKRGKRLCTEAEWEKACKGASNFRYAYGNQWDPQRCNTADEEGNDRTAATSGSFSRCRSRLGVLDLSGNVAEWTATKQGTRYVIKGGSADRQGYDSRCAARSWKAARHSSEYLGFRCCRDPDR